MGNRYKDWLDQAKRDLEHAVLSKENAHHEWACFSAEQAAEKAVKALVMYLGGEPWGHSVLKLLQSLPADKPACADLLDCARRLDRFYIPPRYPNGFDQGKPADYFTGADAEGAIADAEKIISLCRCSIH